MPPALASRPAAPAAPQTPSQELAAELALVLAAQRGSADAFGALVRRHSERSYAVARGIVMTHEDAEDVVQEAFLHAFKALDRFRPEQPFGAWLHRIVANAALDNTRRRKVRNTDELHDVHAAPFRDPAVHRDLRERLDAAMATLPARQRAVLVLHDVEGYKHGEIGEMLGIPEGTARSDLFHARAAMRKALSPLREAR